MGVIADLGLGHVRIETAQVQGASSLGREYGPAEGSPVLRAAIGSWEGVPPEAIAVTTGASMGLVATLATLQRPCSILCPRPYYPAYPKVAAILGLEVIYYDLQKDHDWQPDPECIAGLVREDTRAILWNFPHNPTGSIATPQVLEEMKQLIEQANLLVISDEVYADFVYDATPSAATYHDIGALLEPASVVRLRSFSKFLGIPGERLGYVVADPQRLRAIAQAHWALAMSPPATAQAIALAALNMGLGERIQGIRQALAANRDVAVRILSEQARIKLHAPPAGIFCWIEVPGCPIDSRTLARACADSAGVVVVPGAAFGVETPIYLRASFGVPRDVVIRGFEALSSFLKGLHLS